MNLDKYKARFDALQKHYDQTQGRKLALETQKKTEEKNLNDTVSKLEDYKLEKETVLTAASAAREAGRKLIESISTEALQMSLGKDTSVKLDVSIKRNVPNVDVFITTKNGDTTNPDLDAGGISDLLALSTFMATNSLSKSNEAPLFLDEPTKFVSKDNQEMSSQFIKKIPEYNDRQVFISTHDEYVSKIGKCFYLTKNGDDTTVKTK